MRLLFVLVIVGLIGCNSNQVKNTKPIRLAVFLDSFDKANAKYYDYESTEEWGDSLLKVSFMDASLNRGLLNDYPFTLHDIGRSLEGQFYAHFNESTSPYPDWNLFFDFVVPISVEESMQLEKNGTYRLTNIRNLVPVTEAWKYNVDFPNGTHHFLIRENGRTKIIGLGTSYAEASIVKE